jgi:predicted phosphodiesterase
MIKMAVLSDIHGNLPALKAALTQIATMDVTHIVVLGDLITHFSQYTHEVIELVRNTTHAVIRGNHEGYMIHHSDHPGDTTWEQYDQFSETLKAYRALSSDDMAYLKQLPRSLSWDFGDGFSVRAVHGSPFSEFDTIYPENQPLIAKSLQAIDETVLLCGHTHRAFHATVDAKTLVNPGSVGLCMERAGSAKYALIGWRDHEMHIEMMNAPYDYAAFKASCDWDNPWVRLCLKSMEDGVNYVLKFLHEAKKRYGVFPMPNASYYELFREWCATGVL